MRSFLAFILLSMPFFTAPATATPAGCRLFASYGEEITSCEDNTVLGNAALACVRGYYNRVQSAQKDVLAKFQEQIAKMKEQQNDTFDRTQSGYEDSRKKLEALIAEGHEVRAVVDDLYLNLAFPPDAEEESFTGQSTESYLAQEDCYAIPQRVMIQSQQMTDKIVSDLEAVMAAALGKEYRAQNRSAHVQNINGSRRVSSTSGKGSGKQVPGGKSPASSSDISGTKKAIEDERKSNETLQKK